MSLFSPLDENFPLDRQLEIDAGPVVLANIFTMAPEDEQGFFEAWVRDIHVLKELPGFVSVQIHRAVGDSSTYLVYSTWESVKAFRTAFRHPDFLDTLPAFPSSVISKPHLFQKVAVPGICEGQPLRT